MSLDNKFIKLWVDKESGAVHVQAKASDLVRFKIPEHKSRIDMTILPINFDFYTEKETKETFISDSMTGTASDGTYVYLSGGGHHSDLPTGRDWISIYSNDNETDKEGDRFSFTVPESVSQDIITVLRKIAANCGRYKQEERNANEIKVLNIASDFYRDMMKEWGFPVDNNVMANFNYNPKTGEIHELLVAFPDGRGGAVFDDGKGKWSGSWKGAVATDEKERLSIKIDDPDYREKYFKELRFYIVKMSADMRTEWSDRINILAN